MALVKMKLLNIIGVLDELDRTVDILGDSGMFQPDDAARYFSENENLVPVGGVNEYTPLLEKLQKILTATSQRAEIVNAEKLQTLSSAELSDRVDKLYQELLPLSEERDTLSSEIDRLSNMIEDVKRFVGLGVDMQQLESCEFIKTVLGKLPKESYRKLQSYSDNPFVQFFPCTTDEHFYWGVYVTPLSEADKVDRIFSRLYFEPVEIGGIEGTPQEFVMQKLDEKSELETKLSSCQTEIDAYKQAHRTELLQLFSAVSRHHAYHSIKDHACRVNNSFILVGWIPSDYEGQIKKQLCSLSTIEVTTTDGKEELLHSPPIKLKNHFFARPFEYYTEMYGMPNYNEIDPSGFIALTYTLLFGIMFADLGQGILLLIAAIVMYRVKKMPLGRLLIPCAISSTVFGFLFGSVFGFESLLDPVYKALFGLEEKPIDVMESNTTMILIFGAVAIGVLLLMTAMILNIISSIKRRDIGNALFGVNGVAGFIFYTALVAGLASSMLLGVSIMTTPYVIGLIVLPILLVFLREPLSKLMRHEGHIFGEGFGSFFVDNIFELFEVVLSYITNTMSFLRVGAFVLVHAGMMQVVFVLAGMFGPVGYTITVILGNILVSVLEALLVGIQVLRLEYYEMFSRFFIGDGRKFTPISFEKSRNS